MNTNQPTPDDYAGLEEETEETTGNPCKLEGDWPTDEEIQTGVDAMDEYFRRIIG